MLAGFCDTQIAFAAATFNLADHLAGGIDTAEAIAAEESLDPDTTRRLIRTCASLGLVTSADGMQLSGTSLLSTQLRDAPNSLRGMVLAQAASSTCRKSCPTPRRRRNGMQERLTAVRGDFFESVPPSDSYVLKYILHDWTTRTAYGSWKTAVLPCKRVGAHRHRLSRRRIRHSWAAEKDGHEHVGHERWQGTRHRRVRRAFRLHRASPHHRRTGWAVRRRRNRRDPTW